MQHIHIHSKIICGQCKCEYCAFCYGFCPQCHRYAPDDYQVTNTYSATYITKGDHYETE